jgi:hypothetical protein
LLIGKDCLTYDLARFDGAVGVGGLVQGERRADFDAQFAGVEEPGRLLEDLPLAFPLPGPAED